MIRSELIYNLLPTGRKQPPPPPPPPPPLPPPQSIEASTDKYSIEQNITPMKKTELKSKERKRSPSTEKCNTMGKAYPMPQSSPHQYLQRSQKGISTLPSLEEAKKHWKHMKQLKLNTQSKVDNKGPQLMRRVVINYPSKNRLNIMNTDCKPPIRRYVDDCRGHCVQLNPPKTNPGIEKHYIYRNDYGLVPNYIQKRMNLHKAMKLDMEKYVKEKHTEPQTIQLTDTMLKEVIHNLKYAWDVANQEYSRLPIYTDTLRSARYKEKLENRMKELEKELKKLM